MSDFTPINGSTIREAARINYSEDVFRRERQRLMKERDDVIEKDDQLIKEGREKAQKVLDGEVYTA